jgi:hypothetical protein
VFRSSRVPTLDRDIALVVDLAAGLGALTDNDDYRVPAYCLR